MRCSACVSLASASWHSPFMSGTSLFRISSIEKLLNTAFRELSWLAYPSSSCRFCHGQRRGSATNSAAQLCTPMPNRLISVSTCRRFYLRACFSTSLWGGGGQTHSRRSSWSPLLLRKELMESGRGLAAISKLPSLLSGTENSRREIRLHRTVIAGGMRNCRFGVTTASPHSIPDRQANSRAASFA